ncbi:DODA-type extradiol aromatic ring-opening family dioxygenase [Hirschia baltica]|uniref:Extradiol ring-cleavage dioxygenase class III protein subunit B n=1 Tax=Hirschia baltica (strain ATCC 49814 / DSM 5838 / IFAM 1418) TaxID=582402 RepID=C6XPL8_HIRBI|nr:protocatechuate 4,5-dioxygenase subunit beta [Hirschia baltica]ACT60283.1 Extradiol ring-cleavage dioxygenase class III protein subunit B [Hirschia baltica ATCC 49814]
MAEIVFGMAQPHSGMLGQPPEDWLTNGERDRNNKKMLWYRNKRWDYEDLEAERGPENFEPFLTLEERTQRQARNHAAIQKMKEAYEAANVDVAIILGKDQQEIFTHMSPSIAIYSGEEVHNGPPQRPVFAPDKPVTHNCHPELANYLIKNFEKDGFDITDLFSWPDNVWMKPAAPIVPHAFSFIYHQIMSDNPPPHVPILMNCFYEPTQPPMWRCIDFGKSLVKAIKDWDSDARVAIIASGGLSHFVCDEEFDRKIIEMLGNYDFEGLSALPETSYQSGTSEIKLYTSVMMALKDAGAKMTLVDYVPSYRTPAGTGEGMGFMYWSTDK